MYNFASSGAEERVGRRNNSLLKREAREVLDLVRSLALMNPRQLAAVSHLLSPAALEALKIAMRIPRTNQGRRRQEGLVANLLRAELEEATTAKLQEAARLARDNTAVYRDADVATRVEAWREGLLENDEATIDELFAYPLPKWGVQPQELRQLMRQCQQALQEEAEQQQQKQQQALAAAAALVGVGALDATGASGSSSDEALPALAAGLAKTKGRVPRRSRALLKSLNQLLTTVAEQAVKQQQQEESEELE